jgi:Kef-type K+ transport system membrane component KefB
VIDDVLGLVIVSAAVGLASGRTPGIAGLARLLAIGFGYLLVALAVGVAVAPRVFTLIDRLRARGTLVVSSFAFLLMLAAAAQWAGSAPIIGAFAAGVILSGTAQAPTIGRQMRPVADIFVPVFFVSVGAAADVRVFDPFAPRARTVLAVMAVLLVLGMLGKLAAGWGTPWRRFNRWAVGVGMAPRGEVALVAATAGLAAGALTPELFGAVLGVVMVTMLLTPVLLTGAFARWGVTRDAGSVAGEVRP